MRNKILAQMGTSDGHGRLRILLQRELARNRRELWRATLASTKRPGAGLVAEFLLEWTDIAGASTEDCPAIPDWRLVQWRVGGMPLKVQKPAFWRTRQRQESRIELEDTQRQVRGPGEDPLLWIPRMIRKAHSIRLKLTYPFDGFGRKVSIHPSCEIHRFYAHKIRIGDLVILDPDVWLNVPVISPSPEPAMVIGKGCSIGRRSVISARNRIYLEDDVLLAPAVYITDHNHEYSDVNVPIASQGTTPGERL